MSAPAPHRRGERAATLRRRTAGVVFLLVPALLAWLAVAVYDKSFSDTATVTVETGTAGNEMRVGADVKLRGVVVGRVSRITADGGGARLTLALDPGRLPAIPADVSARMLPTTLFGERYVALVPAPGTTTAGARLAAGTVIPQDRSADAVELQQVLDHTLPLLTAVQPQKLAATLNAVATALRGRGTELGTTLLRLDSYLRELNPELPALNADFHELVRASDVYADAAPDIVQALTDFTTTSGTLAEQRARLATVYGAATTTAQDVTTWLRNNRENVIRLAADSRGTLELLARHAPAFPCTLHTLAAFVPVMDTALGKGTDEPGLHVTVTTVPSRGRYLPGADTPRYDASGGPRCYAVPYTGDPAPTAVSGNGTSSTLGLPNSPQENELVDELLAPGMKRPAASLPDWSSVLAGPVFRGAEVTVK
ncbi:MULTISPECIES: MCE family protein [Streptomycetaceae]|uniref:Secreted protein n=1 Tax=Streptantibioticus cattleyicolor (strain ATCC 35852 / DSM 46488 / JCM 4925 / NBRC 14057 / NRRL 8057) TaxID=1003195 RepID=F8JUG9_STREN|nr:MULTISPECIES: MCE family protein [Streptomycetaceae]AEW95591.1 secreted protein [Streptantibioticus cattleyicolor NRRL 8057 = DSM 46488]MYS60141.1 MCE family protein [Streptomyces sp. SID5468]CCB75928.1 Secreted protein [Streptantibioticus cattleyicolor NRRL 8057 = DSM 46488]